MSAYLGYDCSSRYESMNVYQWDMARYNNKYVHTHTHEKYDIPQFQRIIFSPIVRHSHLRTEGDMGLGIDDQRNVSNLSRYKTFFL